MNQDEVFGIIFVGKIFLLLLLLILCVWLIRQFDERTTYTNLDIGDAENDLIKTKNVRKKSESAISLLNNKLFKKNTQQEPMVKIGRNESDQKSPVPDSSDYRLLKSLLHTGKPITIPEYVRKANEAFEKEYLSKGNKIFNGRDVSPLRYYGYTVGKKGLPIKERREIISITFNSDLPNNIFPQNYMQSWGEAGSSTRYNKILEHLRWLADQRRADRRYKIAVSHWDADRTWLQAARAKR